MESVDENLKVFDYGNGLEVFVARDREDLAKVYKEIYDSTLEENDCPVGEWDELDPDQIIKIHTEEDDYDPEDASIPKTAIISRRDGTVFMEASARDWARANGRGFLCSTEY